MKQDKKTLELLKDENVVMINMLRGSIARPEPIKLSRIYTSEELKEALEEAERAETKEK